jgi:hypothetical protein
MVLALSSEGLSRYGEALPKLFGTTLKAWTETIRTSDSVST